MARVCKRPVQAGHISHVVAVEGEDPIGSIEVNAHQSIPSVLFILFLLLCEFYLFLPLCALPIAFPSSRLGLIGWDRTGLGGGGRRTVYLGTGTTV